MMNLMIATHNKNKIDEFERILRPLAVDVSGAEFGEVEETGTTFAENAFLKADAACRETGKPAVADDSGLMVEALDGAPGVYSSRYAGEGASSKACVTKLLEALRNVPEKKRGARFVSSICCVFPNGDTITAEGECRGRIAFAARGNEGFGYDPVFLVGQKTFAELPPEEKDRISHRGIALRLFAEKLKKYKEQNYADE
jgi:XTP/dITP diphosphohydrolase